MSTLLNDTLAFLHDLKTKLTIWNVVFRDDRGKNTRTLLDLDITPVYRQKVLEDLAATDYSRSRSEYTTRLSSAFRFI